MSIDVLYDLVDGAKRICCQCLIQFTMFVSNTNVYIDLLICLLVFF